MGNAAVETKQITPLQIERQRERALAVISWSVICLLCAFLAYMQGSILTMCVLVWFSGFLGCWFVFRVERYLQMQVDAGTMTHRS